MKRRWRLYLDASFFARLADTPDAPKRRSSEAFLRATARRAELVVSPVVMWELGNTPETPLRLLLLDRVAMARPRPVDFGVKAEELALDLLAAGGWSLRRFADMAHVAYTILAEADALVTWDVHDLARDRTRVVVHAYPHARAPDAADRNAGGSGRMARTKDRVVAAVKRIRRKLSARLAAAHKRGRLHEEMRAVEREGMQFLREAQARVKAAKRKKRA